MFFLNSFDFEAEVVGSGGGQASERRDFPTA